MNIFFNQDIWIVIICNFDNVDTVFVFIGGGSKRGNEEVVEENGIFLG